MSEDAIEKMLADGLLELKQDHDGVRYRFAGADEHETEGEEKWLTRAEVLEALKDDSQ